jgi:hypothetical protein
MYTTRLTTQPTVTTLNHRSEKHEISHHGLNNLESRHKINTHLPTMRQLNQLGGNEHSHHSLASVYLPASVQGTRNENRSAVILTIAIVIILLAMIAIPLDRIQW